MLSKVFHARNRTRARVIEMPQFTERFHRLHAQPCNCLPEKETVQRQHRLALGEGIQAVAERHLKSGPKMGPD